MLVRQRASAPRTRNHPIVKLVPDGVVYPLGGQFAFAPLVDQGVVPVHLPREVLQRGLLVNNVVIIVVEQNVLELFGSGDAGVEPLATNARELPVEYRKAFIQRGSPESVAGPAIAVD